MSSKSMALRIVASLSKLAGGSNFLDQAVQDAAAVKPGEANNPEGAGQDPSAPKETPSNMLDLEQMAP